MHVTIVGAGYVGLTSAAVFASLGHQVCILEKDEEKVEKLSRGTLPFFEPGLSELIQKFLKKGRLAVMHDFQMGLPVACSDAVFICVGTPTTASGKADTRAVFEVAESLALHLSKYTVIVLKSTIPVGTAEKVAAKIARHTRAPFDVASNPEFLREGSALLDSLHPSRIVIGANSKKAREVVEKIHKRLPGKRVITDIRTAEIIKYASNAFLATKISFINEIANLCEAVGANVDDVAKGMGLDPRIGKGFLKAGIGYGGSCFPKDTRALKTLSSENHYDFKLLKAVIEVNQMQRRLFIEKVRRVLGSLKNKRIAALGLAFKNNTDDVRESAALDIIAALQKAGAKITAYDPKANESARARMPRLKIAGSAYEAIKGSECCIILTEWPEFASLPWKVFKKRMHHAIVIDGRNLLDKNKMEKWGYAYHSVGR